MDNKKLKPLNLSKLKSKKSIIVSSQDALKDVTLINWGKNDLATVKTIHR